MKIKFFNPNELDKNIKATVHKTGKLGFTIDAAKKLKLSVGSGLSIGVNEEDPEDINLYVITHDIIAKGAFKINKAGNYFYANTKILFDNLKIDYLKTNIVFDITDEVYEGEKIYKFKRRSKTNKENN